MVSINYIEASSNSVKDDELISGDKVLIKHDNEDGFSLFSVSDIAYFIDRQVDFFKVSRSIIKDLGNSTRLTQYTPTIIGDGVCMLEEIDTIIPISLLKKVEPYGAIKNEGEQNDERFIVSFGSIKSALGNSQDMSSSNIASLLKKENHTFHTAYKNDMYKIQGYKSEKGYVIYEDMGNNWCEILMIKGHESTLKTMDMLNSLSFYKEQ